MAPNSSPPRRRSLCSIPYFQGQYAGQAGCVPDYLTAAYTYPQLPMMLVMVYWGSKLPFHVRVVGSLLVQVVCLVLLPIVVPHSASVFTTLALIFVIGLTTAILQSSVFGLCRCAAV